MYQESQDLQIHSHVPDEPNKDELDAIDAIYRDMPVDASDVVFFRPEQVANPYSRKLYAVSDELNRARSRCLDSQFFIEDAA
ncbi:MAG: hypothetical protein NTV39_01445 [Candidatus Saccharibacteria bacterium]|nr:hypothetical protein [Candidatus Saccharibacteria bacterium]